MDDLISVIVPVYNVEDYLEKSLSSLLIQTYRKLQVIIIDDGSTDNSGEICDYYGANDGRIEVYHIQNAGVSNARNQGLNYAKGKYIYFFDPDDSLEPDALWTLYKQIKNGADLVECSYFKDFTNVKEEVIHQEKKISSQEAIRSLLLWDGYLTSFCWDKLYNKEKIGDIRFDSKLKIGEDNLFVFEYLLKCESVIVLDCPLYNYLIRENSVIGNVYTEKKKDSVRAAGTIYEICSKRSMMHYEAKIHVGLASFFSYANLLNTVPYEKIKEFKSDCKFYIDSMKVCSCGLLWKLVGIKMTILYKTAQYIPFLYKASGFIRRKSR